MIYWPLRTKQAAKHRSQMTAQAMAINRDIRDRTEHTRACC